MLLSAKSVRIDAAKFAIRKEYMSCTDGTGNITISDHESNGNSRRLWGFDVLHWSLLGRACDSINNIGGPIRRRSLDPSRKQMRHPA